MTLQGQLGISSALSHMTEFPSGIRKAFMLQKGNFLASLNLCPQQGSMQEVRGTLEEDSSKEM